MTRGRSKPVFPSVGQGHRHQWFPVKRGFPQRICKCGALGVAQIDAGGNTISVGIPGPVDLIRWSASALPTAAGDVAMDVTSGRPRAFIEGFSRELISFVEGMGPRRQWAVMQEVGQATFNEFGIRPANFTAEGANTRVTTAAGEYINYNTGAAINNDAGVRATAGNYFHTERQFNPIFSMTVRTGATITTIRTWSGLFSDDPMASATPALHEMAFRYDTAVDGTTWQAVTDNGSGTPTVTSTGITYAASTSYLLQIVSNPAGTSVLFFIDGVLVATNAATLPTATQDLGFVVQTRNTAAAARDFMVSNLHCSQLPSSDI